jgi:hypothetical protein
VVADIELDTGDAPTNAAHFFGERVERLERATGEDEVSAGIGQRAGKLLPEATAGACDEGDFASEVEGGHGG